MEQLTNYNKIEHQRHQNDSTSKSKYHLPRPLAYWSKMLKQRTCSLYLPFMKSSTEYKFQLLSSPSKLETTKSKIQASLETTRAKDLDKDPLEE